MLTYYRGHAIVLLQDVVLTAEITECATAVPLPTKVTASRLEGPAMCIERAKALVDIYIDGGASSRKAKSAR